MLYLVHLVCKLLLPQQLSSSSNTWHQQRHGHGFDSQGRHELYALNAFQVALDKRVCQKHKCQCKCPENHLHPSIVVERFAWVTATFSSGHLVLLILSVSASVSLVLAANNCFFFFLLTQQMDIRIIQCYHANTVQYS